MALLLVDVGLQYMALLFNQHFLNLMCLDGEFGPNPTPKGSL